MPLHTWTIRRDTEWNLNIKNTFYVNRSVIINGKFNIPLNSARKYDALDEYNRATSKTLWSSKTDLMHHNSANAKTDLMHHTSANANNIYHYMTYIFCLLLRSFIDIYVIPILISVWPPITDIAIIVIIIIIIIIIIIN